MAGIGQALLAIANVCTSVMSAIIGFYVKVYSAGLNFIINLGKGFVAGVGNA